MNKKVIIDLFCGKGRFPGALSIDFDRKVKPDIVADVRNLPLKEGLKIDHVHASPPCTYISKARRWRYGTHLLGIAESLELIAQAYRAFYYLGAKKYTIEQPAGLEDILGKKISFKYDKGDIRNAKTNFYSNSKSHRRAIIPQWVRVEITK